MADDKETLRELNEAVLPVKFSLEAQKQAEAADAKYRLSTEGFEKQPATPVSTAIENGGIALSKDGNTEWGLSFGRQSSNDNQETDERFGPRPDLQNLRRGKTVGAYLNIKF